MAAMNVFNVHRETLQQILPKIQKLYPDAFIKKVFTGAEVLQVQHDNFEFAVSKTGTDFQVDCNPPIAWLLGGFAAAAVIFSFICSSVLDRAVLHFGGVVPGVIAFFMVKGIFKLANKGKIKQFNNNFVEIINGIRKTSSKVVLSNY
jgi:hypothetical protein